MNNDKEQGNVQSTQGSITAVVEDVKSANVVEGKVADYVKPAAEAHPVNISSGVKDFVKVLHEGQISQEAVASIKAVGVSAEPAGDAVQVSSGFSKPLIFSFDESSLRRRILDKIRLRGEQNAA